MKLTAKLNDYDGTRKYYGTIVEIEEDGEFIGELVLWNNTHHNAEYENSPRETESIDNHMNSHWENGFTYNVAKEVIKRINKE